jgi:hypothetical protein
VLSLKLEETHEDEVALSGKSEESDVVEAHQKEISIEGMDSEEVNIDCLERSWQVAGREVVIWLFGLLIIWLFIL